jgi:hypothetical protein
MPSELRKGKKRAWDLLNRKGMGTRKLISANILIRNSLLLTISCAIVPILSFLLAANSASGAAETAPKAFAVFVASYNSAGNEVLGGVAGTLFFVTPTRAITAYHVLQAASFKPLPGFRHVRVWLVHENEPAIELKPEYLTSRPDRDLTMVNLPATKAVRADFVYASAARPAPAQTVESEGYIANSTGPALAWNGPLLEITAVPRLARLHLTGTLVRHALVNLDATDVKLNASPDMELSYRPVVGMSGGPVLAGGKVVAMNSFADPTTREHTWALTLTDL